MKEEAASSRNRDVPFAYEMFVGSYAPADEPGIYAFEVAGPEPRLNLKAAFSGVTNPSFIALHPGGDLLFAVSETGGRSDGANGAVHAFRIERTGGAVDLVALNHRSTAGDHPCHLRLDAGGHWIVVSNYGSGDVAVFPIGVDGMLGEMVSFVQHSGTGPNADRQEGPHAHSAIFTPDNRFLIVADLGIDRLVVYRFDASGGSLALHGEVATQPGAGPRHLAFHPEGRHLFVVNELDSTLTCYSFDSLRGVLEAMQTMATVPAESPGNIGADLHVSGDGRHVYVSNRGHNSLATYTFDVVAGLSRVAVRPSGGDWPRGFGLAPDERLLVVANRRSNEIAVLPLLDGGAATGEPAARTRVTQPACITFS